MDEVDEMMGDALYGSSKTVKYNLWNLNEYIMCQYGIYFIYRCASTSF